MGWQKANGGVERGARKKIGEKKERTKRGEEEIEKETKRQREEEIEINEEVTERDKRER